MAERVEPLQFELSAEERFMSGVRFDPESGSLVLRASGGFRALNAGYGVCFMLFVAFGIALVAMRMPMGLLSVVLGVALAIPPLRFLRTRVEATPGGVELVARWSRTYVDWSHVTDIAVRHTKTTALRSMFGGVPRDATDLVIGDRFDHDAPVLARDDGPPIVLTVLASLARNDGFSIGDPSPAEVKTELLRRYREAVGG